MGVDSDLVNNLLNAFTSSRLEAVASLSGVASAHGDGIADLRFACVCLLLCPSILLRLGALSSLEGAGRFLLLGIALDGDWASMGANGDPDLKTRGPTGNGAFTLGCERVLLG